MTTTWTQIFEPVQKAKGLDPRPQQAALGQAIINSLYGQSNLVAQALVGTGKSYAILVPMIHKILEAKAEKKKLRGIVSTETLVLQNQYVETDLPALQKIFPGFTYRSLKGRANYVCFNAIKLNARGNQQVAAVERKLNTERTRLGAGERKDVERVLGRELDDHFWKFLGGSSQGCSDNACAPDECYSAKARAEALTADIVIVNHALLRVDADTRDDEFGGGDAFLGDVDFLAVDEAHTLEDVLISGWTEELSEWELLERNGKIIAALDFGKSLINDPTIGFETQHANEGIEEFLKTVTKFFGLMHIDEEWKRVEETISLKYLTPGGPTGIIHYMDTYENDGPRWLATALDQYEKVEDFLKRALEQYEDMGIKKGRRILTKGRTAVREMKSIVSKLSKAIATKDGTITEYGVPYVLTASGIERRNGDRSVRLRVIPLDISSKAKGIWENRRCILMSGTLMDLTDGSFRYATTSLGFTNYAEISTESPFDHKAQQVVYVTPAKQEKVDLKGAQFSLDEMVDLVKAANGRTLVLFTSKAEMDVALTHVRQLAAAGDFPWTVLAQEPGVNKMSLAERFREDKHSVLFASKSFFTGNNFPGETLSLVILVKFPLPRFDAVCKQQISWWRTRGFPRYYEMKALEVFHQAAGRLIRSASDTGVVALLDQRAMDTTQRVYTTALQGVQTLKSPVTQDIEVVKKYLS